MGLPEFEFKSPKVSSPHPNRRAKATSGERTSVRFEKVPSLNNASGERHGEDRPPRTEAGNPESFIPSTHFPSVGNPPGTATWTTSNGSFAAPLAAAGEQWHTAADPTRSVGPLGSGAYQPLPGLQAHPQHFQSQFGGVPGTANSAFSHQPVTGTVLPPYPPRMPSMTGDYANTAPPPMGVNFQPPVPDTTYGPMHHMYTPRFDGGGAYHPVLQVCPPHSYYPVVPPAPVFPHAMPISNTVPSTSSYVYMNGVGHHYQPGVQPGYVLAQQPPFVQAMPNQQPMFMNGQACMPPGPPGAHHFQAMTGAAVGGPPPFFPGNTPPFGNPQPPMPPDISGAGSTPGEEQLRQIQFAHANKLFEPQEFKPADEDPSRFYYVRELDGNWTQRNRFTIDHMGNVRWYITDEGWFYAVRLPD